MKVTTKSLLVAIMLSSVLGIAACKQEGQSDKEGQKVSKAGEQADKRIENATEQANKKIEKDRVELSDKSKDSVEFIDDSAITVKINEAIANDPLVKMSQITVMTTNGVVRLSGMVDSTNNIDRLLEITRSIKNVKSTENNLVVKSSKL